MFWDWKDTLFLQALNSFIQALFHWDEFDAQILDLLVCELVVLFSWVLLIRTPANALQYKILIFNMKTQHY